MKKLEMPVFNNSCGKIFNDKIVLASSHREDELAFEDVKKVKFGMATSLKSLMWALLPSSIFVLLYLERQKLHSSIFFLLSFVAIGISVFSLIMAEKSYYILFKTNDGLNVKVKVSVDNKKDAKKFTEMCSKKINRKKPGASGLKVVKDAA